MSAEHEFEKQVSRQLDALRISPHEDDWQRIYERLHPRRRRRLLWWWLAAVLVLGGAGIYLAQQPAGNAQGHAVATVPGTTAAGSSDTASAAGTTTMAGHAPTASQSSTASPAWPGTPTIAEQSDAPRQPVFADLPVSVIAGTTKAGGALRRSKTARSGSAAGLSENELLHATGRQRVLLPTVQSETAGKSTTTDVSSLASAEPGPVLIDPSLQTIVAPLDRQLPPAGQLLPPQPAMPATPALEKNGASQRSWRWGAYVGAGISQLRQSLTTTKAQADVAVGNPGGSGAGTVRALQQTNQQSGHFWQAGLLGQYEWRQRARLQMGLGVAQHRWEATSTGRVDSFANTGAFVANLSSYRLQTAQRVWLLELPLQYGRRLTANRPLSIWAEAAVVSAFQVSASQRVIRAEQSGSSRTADTSSAVRLAAFWLPQTRLGLSLQKRGRWQWQLSPAVTYSLNSGVQVGSLRRHLLTAQLQWRLLLPTGKH